VRVKSMEIGQMPHSFKSGRKETPDNVDVKEG